MKASLFLLFIQLVTLISAAPTNHKKSKGKKSKHSGNSDDEGDIVNVGVISTSAAGALGLTRSSVNYNLQVALPVTSVEISGQNFSLLLDSGSGLTIVGMSSTFVASDTTIPEAIEFTSNFGSGSVAGIIALDNMRVLTVDDDLNIANVTIGIAAVVVPEFLTEIDGIWGLALKQSTAGDFADGTAVPTVLDTAQQQQLINENQVGLSLNFPKSLDPQDSLNVGQITFGGINSSLVCGDLDFTDLSKGADLWTLDSPQVSLGNTSLATNVTLTIDSGTTQVLFSQSVFDEYVQLSGGTVDANGTIHFTQDQVNNLDDLIFQIGGVLYRLVADAQVFPQHLNPAPGFGGSSTDDILGVVASGGPVLSNTDFILGQGFMVEHYVVLDTGDKSVGLGISVDSIQGCPS